MPASPAINSTAYIIFSRSFSRDFTFALIVSAGTTGFDEDEEDFDDEEDDFEYDEDFEEDEEDFDDEEDEDDLELLDFELDDDAEEEEETEDELLAGDSSELDEAEEEVSSELEDETIAGFSELEEELLSIGVITLEEELWVSPPIMLSGALIRHG